MRIPQLTHLGFQLNGAQGTGKYDSISINEIKALLKNGTLFEFLGRTVDIDTSILTNADQLSLNEEWLDMAMSINQSRKFCVDKGGLCLLVAYVFESIQRLLQSAEN